MKFKSIFFLLFLWVHSPIHAQISPRFWKEIQDFKHKDSLNFPNPGSILFVGSSSFQKWTDVSDYFPGFNIINRGFGGSILLDLIRYEPLIIKPYHSRQIIIYCGENDFAEDPNLDPKQCFKRFTTLFRMIRKDLPAATIDFVSIKPSPSRFTLQKKFTEANSLIKAFLKKQKKAQFIDIVREMLSPNGALRPELYLEDGLHMKADGYKIWKKTFLPYLIH